MENVLGGPSTTVPLMHTFELTAVRQHIRIGSSTNPTV